MCEFLKSSKLDEFLEYLLSNLEESYPQITKKYLTDSKPSLETQEQFDLSQISKMKKDELVAMIVNLLVNLPDSRDQLEKFIFQSPFFNVIETDQLKSIFRQLEGKLKFNLLKSIEDLTNAISVENENQFQ